MSSGIIVSLIFLRLLVAWIGLAGIWLPLCNQPRNNICNFLWCHRSVRRTIAPIGMAKIRAPSDDSCAQILIADEREKGAINNGASLFRAFGFESVTSSAEGCVGLDTPSCVARFVCGIRGRAKSFFRIGPTRAHLMDQDINLVVRQHSPRALCKSGHQ